MQPSLCCEREFYPRHFTDVLVGFMSTNGNDLRSHSSGVTFKRRPKCKTKNKCTPYYESHVHKMSDCRTTLSSSPNCTVPTFKNIHTVFINFDQLKLRYGENESAYRSVWKAESLPYLDILCALFQPVESVTPLQAVMFLRWLTWHQAIWTACSTLVKILISSDFPLVSLSCCRTLKWLHFRSRMMSGMLLPSSEYYSVDVVAYVLCLQKEMVKFLETKQLSMNLLNVIYLLDCINFICCHVSTQCSSQHFSRQFCSRWCSSELRWAALSVMSLARALSTKIRLDAATISHAADTDSHDKAKYVRRQLGRVPRIVGDVLTTSVQCEVFKASNIHCILNEYWHTGDFCQRQLIVESVLDSKLRMEMCVMILARHCDVSLRESFVSVLSLGDISSMFDENALVHAVIQRMWIEDNKSLVASHCREICVTLCIAVCSYISYQKG